MIKTILPHIGNKSRTTGFILPHISTDTDVFIEPFCGSCAVTLDLLQSRPNHFRHIICSDLNESIIYFWRAVKEYGGEFSTLLADFIRKNSEEDFFKIKPKNALEQGIFYYIQVKCSYYSCINSSKNFEKFQALRYGLSDLDSNKFEYFKNLIQPIEFEVMDYKEAIKKAKGYSDSISAFFDPPYSSKSAFSKGFYAFDFVDIVDIFESTEGLGNVVITYNDDDFCKEICKNYGFNYKLRDLRELSAISRLELYMYK